ncbi:hypothetical protein [Bauldia litoralis]|uniref:Aldose 1-epimerase n=1 Tax=Bauldia litoralis TaxID=665467 RepID=A0A1G6CSM3_9HYPH|nr:hypothetical protein [Bauldia litoralis]SDB35857.1 hypothetical protein SAMN02982931_02695 [Bauldia litoralis]
MTDTPYRGLGWAHGALTVQRLGAMLAPVTFLLADGRQVSPMQVAPWAGEAGTEDLPGILRKLRGEWPCVPFGYSVPPDGFAPDWAAAIRPADPGEEAHGHSSNTDWQWQSAGDGALKLALDYPESSPIARVERTVTPDPDAPAIDCEFRVEVREDCRLPIGLHPVFRLPLAVGGARLEPGRFDHGLTYPSTVEPAAPLFAIDARFDDLEKVPGRFGTVVDASRLPLSTEAEELLQLNGIDGTAALANEAEGYRVRLTWQKEHFPSLLLWYSNAGRKMAPWNGRHIAIGIEPICSPFGLGPPTAQADNPISLSGTPTALAFKAGEPFVTRYRIAAEPL